MVEKRNKKLLNEINEAKERIIYLKNAIKFDTNRAEDEKQYWIENNKGRKFEDAKMHELHDYGNLISKEEKKQYMAIQVKYFLMNQVICMKCLVLMRKIM